MAEPMQLPPQAQQLLMQMQTFQQQVQAIAIQKDTLNMQKLEFDKALEELKRTKDGEDVYKAVGPILIKSSKSELVKELSDKLETIEVRLKSLDKQEDKVKEKLQEGQQQLQQMLMLSGTTKKGKSAE